MTKLVEMTQCFRKIKHRCPVTSDNTTAIHFFRIGVEASKEQTQEIMKFAGCWRDMSDEMFSDLSKEFAPRRKKAFSGRRDNDTSLD